jgi:hypothetical protein
MEAKCNSSGVQENLNNSKLGNSEYHIIHSMIRIKTNTVHWVMSIYVYCYAAPTCFGTYVPSSGSIFVLVSYVKAETAV